MIHIHFPPETPILIVDDNPQFAGLLKRLLSAQYEFTTIDIFESPEEALPKVRENKEYYQLFFVDFNFPGATNGCDFLSALGDEGVLEGKTAFLITSEPTGDNVRRAMDAGARGVVGKPFNRDDLHNQLQKAARAKDVSGKEEFTIEEE